MTTAAAKRGSAASSGRMWRRRRRRSEDYGGAIGDLGRVEQERRDRQMRIGLLGLYAIKPRTGGFQSSVPPAGRERESGELTALPASSSSKRVRLAPIVSLLVASRAFALRFSLAFFCGGP